MTGNEHARRARERLLRVLGEEPPRWLVVDVAGQSLDLIEGGRVTRSWRVSTAAAGIDAREGSLGTPPGLHRIAQKIGAGMTPGTVFESRRPTGEVWPVDGGTDEERSATAENDLILSRVMTLYGLEDGVNRGPGIDSLKRYIYLHGSNHEDRIGEPVSHGCIRLSNHDVIDLFERIEVGDPLVIV